MPERRPPRTKDQLDAFDQVLYDVVAAQHPMTVRQVFYQALTAKLVDKTKQGYRDVSERLKFMRKRPPDPEHGRSRVKLPADWINDPSRWVDQATTFGSPQEGVAALLAQYRRDIWADLDVHVEMWLEKNALRGIVRQVTDAYAVPLCVSVGWASKTYVDDAVDRVADAIRADKRIALYQVGDYDPSGVGIPKSIERQLRVMCADERITMTRIAVTPEQVARWSLPTRLTKTGDSRAGDFGSARSVEVDAVPPRQLQQIVKSAITRHLPRGHMARVAAAEALDKASLERLARKMRSRR